MDAAATSEDSFTRSAGFRLLVFILLATLGIGALMLLLSAASGLMGSNRAASLGVDVIGNGISLLLREEPPQLDSTRQTDQVSGMVLGHVMEGLTRYNQRGDLVGAVAERWEINPDNCGSSQRRWREAGRGGVH